MMNLKIIPKRWNELKALISPVDASQPEAVPYVLYDSQQYISATSTRLSFFQNVSADKTLSNMETSGVLPSPQHFEIHRVFIDVLSRPSIGAGVATGQADDISLLFHTARATLTYTGAGKRWGPIPARFAGPSGSINTALTGTLTAPATVQGGWRDFTGGFPINGQLVIPPMQAFLFDLDFAGAQTLVGGNTYISVGLLGVLHRRVS